ALLRLSECMTIGSPATTWAPGNGSLLLSMPMKTSLCTVGTTFGSQLPLSSQLVVSPVSVALENAVLPPVAVMLNCDPAGPALWSQARIVIASDRVPLKPEFGW